MMEGFGPPAAPRRARNLAGSLLGLLLIVVCAFGVALFTTNAGRHRLVLVVVRPVRAGALVQRADLGETRVSVDATVHVVNASDVNKVVGHQAGVNLAPGTLVSFDQLRTGPPLSAVDAVVGLALKPGQLPSTLQPLDRVMLVHTAGTAGSASPAESGAAPVSAPPSTTVLVPSAEVFAIDQASDLQTTIVSVVVPTSSAPAVAAASAADQISVALLGGTGP
jgi:hypothetical protein